MPLYGFKFFTRLTGNKPLRAARPIAFISIVKSEEIGSYIGSLQLLQSHTGADPAFAKRDAMRDSPPTKLL